MSAILEAIDTELAAAEAKVDQLRILRQSAADVVAPTPEPSPEPSRTATPPRPRAARGRRPAQKPPPSDPPRASRRKRTEAERKADDKGSAAMRNGQAKRTQERRAQVIAIVKRRPGLMLSELAEELGTDAGTTGKLVHSLASGSGILRIEPGQRRAKHVFLREHDMAPADANGAKTEVERKVLAAVQAAPVALTTSEVSSNAGINVVDAGRVLHGLRQRGVVRAVPSRSDNAPQRWEMPHAALREAA